jgi:transcriptional regulator with XRE-family HTH domain
MKIDGQLTDEAVLAELGARLKQLRLEQNTTQSELARQAGVERKALQRIESGQSVTLVSLVRILRALGLLEALDGLLAEPGPGPVELLALQGRRRRRASGRRASQGRPADPPRGWRWGDERPGPGP